MATKARPVKAGLHRTTIDIELEPYERAQEILGTSGFKETVNAALREVVRREQLKRFADKISRNEFRAPTPEELEEMRKPRTFG
jgi:Arc/MetJ family transcription regulator